MARVVIPPRAKGLRLEVIFDFLEQLVHGCDRHLPTIECAANARQTKWKRS
jgi:hypothetical protein